MALESVFRDVATIVSEKCVNPASNRPYTVRDWASEGERKTQKHKMYAHIKCMQHPSGLVQRQKLGPQNAPEERVELLPEGSKSGWGTGGYGVGVSGGGRSALGVL